MQPETPKFLYLRNVIVHGYATVEDETIWGIVQSHVAQLHEKVNRLL